MKKITGVFYAKEMAYLFTDDGNVWLARVSDNEIVIEQPLLISIPHEALRAYNKWKKQG